MRQDTSTKESYSAAKPCIYNALIPFFWKQPWHCLPSVAVADAVLDASCRSKSGAPRCAWLDVAVPVPACSAHRYLGGITPFPLMHSRHLAFKVYGVACSRLWMIFPGWLPKTGPFECLHFQGLISILSSDQLSSLFLAGSWIRKTFSFILHWKKLNFGKSSSSGWWKWGNCSLLSCCCISPAFALVSICAKSERGLWSIPGHIVEMSSSLALWQIWMKVLSYSSTEHGTDSFISAGIAVPIWGSARSPHITLPLRPVFRSIFDFESLSYMTWLFSCTCHEVA